MERNWQEGFPKDFRQHPLFPELETVVERIIHHSAMRMTEPHVLNNMIRASLAFTVCFYGHIWGAFQSVFGTPERVGPFGVQTELSLLHVLFELAREELTDRIPNRAGFGPHYVMMLDAANLAGINTLPIETIVMRLRGPRVISVGISDLLQEYSLAPALCDYLDHSYRIATTDGEGCLLTLALREITLSASFRTILDNLPTDEKYDGVRAFYKRHVSLDEGTHGPLMTSMLRGLFYRPEQIARALRVMITFYTFRLEVYDRCLEPEPLY